MYIKNLSQLIKDKKAFSLSGELIIPDADDRLGLKICQGNIYINKDGRVQKIE